MHLLVTRPAPGAEQTAAKLNDLGHQTTIESLSIIQATDIPFPKGNYSAIAVTSAAAIRQLASHEAKPHLLKLPLYCVGDATARAAKTAGFTNITSANGNAGDLLKLLPSTAHGKSAPTLYISGEDRAFDLTAAMQKSGRQCVEWVIYRARWQERFSVETSTRLQADEFDGVLLYSARAAGHFSDLCLQQNIDLSRSELKYFCLSPQIAATLPKLLQSRCFCPDKPHEDALLTTLAETNE